MFASAAAGHLQALGIRYLHGKALKVQARPNGGQVDLADGTQLPYERLLVATGSSPSLPPILQRSASPGVVIVLDAGGRTPDRRQADPGRLVWSCWARVSSRAA